MNNGNQTMNGVSNCSVTLLGLNLSYLSMLNESELMTIVEKTIDSSSGSAVLYNEFLECLAHYQKRPYDLPLWQELAWSLIFAVMLLIATGGNVIVIWIVLAHRGMRTVTNYFLVNLSVADLLTLLVNCAFNFTFLLNSSWPFGAVYCTINNFVSNMTIASSVFTMVVISFDR